LYDYTVLQEVKESLYDYNDEQIARDLQNYLFALNFEPGTLEFCKFTGDKLEITEEFLENIENHVVGAQAAREKRRAFRKETQKEYTSNTLTQEMMLEGKALTATTLYAALYDRYVYNLKEHVLDPMIENDTFRRALKDYETDDFKTYSTRIIAEVNFLIDNLCTRYRYTKHSAKEVCLYVIDRNLTQHFAART